MTGLNQSLQVGNWSWFDRLQPMVKHNQTNGNQLSVVQSGYGIIL
jgi:hypothetical protein